MIRLTRWMARWSSAIRVRDKAIRLLQDRNRMLAMELALVHSRPASTTGSEAGRAFDHFETCAGATPDLGTTEPKAKD